MIGSCLNYSRGKDEVFNSKVGCRIFLHVMIIFAGYGLTVVSGILYSLDLAFMRKLSITSDEMRQFQISFLFWDLVLTTPVFASLMLVILLPLLF